MREQAELQVADIVGASIHSPALAAHVDADLGSGFLVLAKDVNHSC